MVLQLQSHWLTTMQGVLTYQMEVELYNHQLASEVLREACRPPPRVVSPSGALWVYFSLTPLNAEMDWL